VRSARLQPGRGVQGGGIGGKHPVMVRLGGLWGLVCQELFRAERFKQLWTVKAVGPDFHFTEGWAGKSQKFERKDHPLQKKLVAAAATQDDHPVRGVAEGAILEHPLDRRGNKARIWAIQRVMKAESDPYS
jgi:hypothetical protein